MSIDELIAMITGLGFQPSDVTIAKAMKAAYDLGRFDGASEMMKISQRKEVA